jgi:hypothetical protein
MEFLFGLKKLVGTDCWGQPMVSFVTLSISTSPGWRDYNPYLIWHDWKDNQTREMVIKEGLKQYGISTSIFNKKSGFIKYN